MKKMHFIFWCCIFTLTSFSQIISETDKIAFCYLENKPNNIIVIPNFRGTLYHFKLYRKTKADTSFKFVTELKKPSLALRSNKPGIYSVSWEDKDYHSRALDYKIIYYGKNDEESGTMNVVWEKEK